MHGVDVIGDVHGHLAALRALGRQLGYHTEGDWSHPEGRVLVFLGDLVDRGPQSLDVAQLVMSLVSSRRAHCLMGNHEYNILDCRWCGGNARVTKHSALADIEQRPAQWEPVLDFFATLPLAIELPGLRIVHACWHRASVEALIPRLVPQEPRAKATTTWEWVAAHVVLESPFQGRALRAGLPRWGVGGSHNTMHEVLIKGFERPVSGIVDAEGKERPLARMCWWREDTPEVDTSTPTVFGHYWSLPPVDERIPFAPPAPNGSPAHKEWLHAYGTTVPAAGLRHLDDSERHVCVDYNGTLLDAPGRGSVGAYRYPERTLVWAMEPAG
jgi:hypothetical protein